MSYKHNPFTGTLDRVNDIDTAILTAASVSIVYNCDSSALIGDLVVLSTTTVEFVDVLTSNVYIGLSIGQIVAKPSSTRAEVQVLGIINAVDGGLSIGLPVFISPAGRLTTTKPTTGSIQVMGVAIAANKFTLIPGTNKVTLL